MDGEQCGWGCMLGHYLHDNFIWLLTITIGMVYLARRKKGKRDND